MQLSEPLHQHNAHDHRAEQVQAWLKVALLIGLGAYFAYNIVSGNLTNYINMRFAWLSYVAAALFFVLGAFGVYQLFTQKHQHDHDHDHSLSWGMLAIIAVPLLLGTLIPSKPLGAEAIDGNVSMNVVSVSEQGFTGDPLQWNVLDWLRAFNASDDMTEFNGQQANILGFVYRDESFSDDQFMLARFTISCCVADASPIGLPVVWADAGGLAPDTWVQISGTFRVGEFRGEEVPMLHAASIETVEEPEHPYLYP